MAAKLKLAVWKFSSCDGCQLSLLDCEDQLLAVAEAVEIAYFLEAGTVRRRGPFDISLVEGSVATEHDLQRIQDIRRRSKTLIAIGACATSGGVQALRYYGSLQKYLEDVYPQPRFIKVLEHSTPISDHVPVDLELRGCPISKTQLLEVLAALVQNRKPDLMSGCVCHQCKLNGNVCVMVTRGLPCMGPVTQAGCGAICPSYDRGCYGCFGPQKSANTQALAAWLAHQQHRSPEELVRAFRGINCRSPEFAEESERHEAPDQG